MKSTPIPLGSALLEEAPPSGFRTRARSFGKRVSDNDGVKEFPSARDQLTSFPMESGFVLTSRGFDNDLRPCLHVDPKPDQSCEMTSVPLAPGCGAEAGRIGGRRCWLQVEMLFSTRVM